MRRGQNIILATLMAILVSGSIAYSAPSPEPSTGLQDRTRAEAEHAGNKLMGEARKKFKRGEFWKCAMDLIVILDFYSEFSRIDETLYLLGRCLYEMGMYDGSNQLFRYLLRNYPRTPLVPKVMLGMQKAYYQEREYHLSLKFYNALESHYSDFDGIDESRYYAVQSHYHLKNYNLVSNIIEQIKKGSEFYAFALYTSGLADLKKKISGRPSSVLSS